MPVRSVLCIGRVSVRTDGTNDPREVWRIYNVAKELGTKFQTRGVISFQSGSFLQIIEGEPAEIEESLKDKRLGLEPASRSVILELDLSVGYLSESPLSLVKEVAADLHLIKYFEDHVTHIEGLLDNEERERLNAFYPLDLPKDSEEVQTMAIPGAEPVTNVQENLPVEENECVSDEQYLRHDLSLEGKLLKISSWPDFSRTRQTPFCLELCAMLLPGFCSFDDLVTENFPKQEAEIYQILGHLHNQGSLLIMETEKPSPPIKKKSRTLEFCQKLRSFLTH